MADAAAPEVWTLLKVLQWTQGRFTERRLGTPRLDAEVLLGHVLGYDRTKLYTHFDQPLLPHELAAYKELIKRRLGGEPVAYIIGKKEFRSLELEVSPAVLIPRPDTETLVEAALEIAAGFFAATGRALGSIVDVGTGSGAVAIALAKAISDSAVVAIDRSPEAAAVARQNAERLGAPVEVRVGDLLAPLTGEAVDLIVANLPYIPTGDLAGLAPEVQREPRSALDGGADGLAVVARLVSEAPRALLPGGVLLLEIGAGQAGATEALLLRAGFVDVVRRKDLGGIVRVVGGRRPPQAGAATSAS